MWVRPPPGGANAPADVSTYQVLRKSVVVAAGTKVVGASGRSRSGVQTLSLCSDGRLVSLRSGGKVKPRICCTSVFMVCESQQRVKGRADGADRAGLYLGNA